MYTIYICKKCISQHTGEILNAKGILHSLNVKADLSVGACLG